MMNAGSINIQKRSTGKRILRILLKTVLILLGFVILIVILIQTSPVQNFIRGKAVTWLEKKLNTKVDVGKIYIGFPKDVVIEKIYIEDLEKDTLLSAGKLKVDISLLKLLSNDIEINDVTLKDVTAKIKRQLPDTTFNFQFIIDAFTSGDKKETTTQNDTTSSFAIKSVSLDKIRLLYKDVITGNDVETWLDHFETKISKIDLARSQFDISRFTVDGLNAKVYQSKPIVKAEPESKDVADAKEPVPFQLNLKELLLKKIKLDYRNDVSSFYTSLDLDKLLVRPDKIDLEKRIIDLDELELNQTTAAIRLGKTQQAKVVEKETEQELTSQAESGWQILAASIRLNNNNLLFDNDNNTRGTTGIDYAHLNAGNLTLHVDNFYFSSDSISGKIKKGSLAEKSGLDVEKLQTDFTYSDKGASLKNLLLKTSGTELKDEAIINYHSLESLKADPGNMQLDISLQNSFVQVKDILTFVPGLKSQPAFSNPQNVFYINSELHGRLSQLYIDKFQVGGLTNTKADIAGSISGIPDIKKLKANLVIRSMQSTRKDLMTLLPAGSLPENISPPENFSLTGKINGGMEKLATSLLLKTNAGDISVDGNASQITDKNKAEYNATIGTRQLNIGSIMNNKEVAQAVSATFTIQGSGYDKKTADATVNSIIHSATFKEYTYRDLKLNGSIKKQQADFVAAIKDPNVHLSVEASGELSGASPAVKLTAAIDSIKTAALHLTTDNIIYRGKINGDFTSVNPDSLDGNLNITQSLLIKDGQRIQLDSIGIIAGNNSSGQFIHINSDFISASLQGKYKLTEIGNVFQQAVEPYFSTANPDSTLIKTPYDFTFNAFIIDKPALKVLVPGLERMDSISLQSRFSTNNGWNASLKAPAIHIGTNKIDNLVINAQAGESILKVNGQVEQINSGSNIELHHTTINAGIKNNKIDFGIITKDREDKIRYTFAGLFEQPQKGKYGFSLNPDSLLLNYAKWSLPTDNKIEIGEKNIFANNFALSREGQELKIQSTGEDANAPVELSFRDFKLKTLTGFIQPDSTIADGLLNGKLLVSDLPAAPVFTGNLTINNLSIKNDTVGNVALQVNNKVADTYFADITVSDRGNDVHLTGNYYAKQADNNFDFLLDIKNLPLTTAQAFSRGAITNASGSVNGKFTVKGNIDNPKVNGDLNFVQAKFNPTQLNNTFQIDKEKIEINESGIRFNRFSVLDSIGNRLTLNGAAATTNFRNYKLDFTIRANDFRALNSTKKDNKLFYGQLFFNTNLRVKGTETAPVVDGSITINEKTKMTVVLPQDEPGVADREGVIEFIDVDAPANDSLFLAAYDSLNKISTTGMDIAVNVDIKKEADLTLVIDEANGDFLNVHGEALLTAGVDPSGKVTLAGSYELESGAYQLSLNLLRRKFAIEKGSKIIWTGEPTEADVNITASYEANTAPLDLVKNQLDANLSATERNTYLQKLPFEVYLKMKGKLLKPDISFDIVLPEDKQYNVAPSIVSLVRSKLELVRQETGELNKQVFALLLLNRFVGENPFNSSSSMNAETFARQSASKLLTEQLNRLAENLVEGVDLNFDVESSEDYTTGQRQNRTDLNVGLSKRLLNDRLTITVGSNFELEGAQNSNRRSSNIAGNVAINYRLSKDGRYAMRAYRKNEYQGILDGYIIETGVGFIITIDYNRVRQIFQKQKTRRDRKDDPEERETKSQAILPEQSNNKRPDEAN